MLIITIARGSSRSLPSLLSRTHSTSQPSISAKLIVTPSILQSRETLSPGWLAHSPLTLSSQNTWVARQLENSVKSYPQPKSMKGHPALQTSSGLKQVHIIACDLFFLPLTELHLIFITKGVPCNELPHTLLMIHYSHPALNTQRSPSSPWHKSPRLSEVVIPLTAFSHLPPQCLSPNFAPGN